MTTKFGLQSSITRVDADLPNKLHESSLFPLRCILSLHICDPTTWLEPSKGHLAILHFSANVFEKRGKSK